METAIGPELRTDTTTRASRESHGALPGHDARRSFGVVLEVGKLADLAVWDRDPYLVPASALKEMRCLLTVFDGKVVYTAPGARF